MKAMYDISDINKLCNAILEDYIYFDTSDNSRDQYSCEFCSGVSVEWAGHDDIANIKHHPDCVVLIAQRLFPNIVKRELKYGTAKF